MTARVEHRNAAAPLSDEEHDQILSLHERGLSPRGIADQIGRSRSGVLKLLIREGKIVQQKTGVRVRPFTAEEDVFIAEQYPTVGSRVCAVKLGRSAATVSCRAMKLGVQLEYKNKTHKKLTAEQDAEVVRLYRDEGRAVADLAVAFGVKPDAIYKRLKLAGIVNHTKAKRWTDQSVLDEIKRLFLADISVSEIARQFSTSTTCVSTALKRMGYASHVTYPQGRVAFTDRRGRQFMMRSQWEIKVAQWLDERAAVWDYEPRRYAVKMPEGNTASYTPDFAIYDGALTTLVEVKGVESKQQAAKIERFVQQYSAVRFEVWRLPDLIARGVKVNSKVSSKRSRKVEHHGQGS